LPGHVFARTPATRPNSAAGTSVPGRGTWRPRCLPSRAMAKNRPAATETIAAPIQASVSPGRPSSPYGCRSGGSWRRCVDRALQLGPLRPGAPSTASSLTRLRVVLLSLDEALDVHPAGGERHSRRQTVQDGTVFDPDMHVVCVVAADSRHDSDDVDVVDA